MSTVTETAAAAVITTTATAAAAANGTGRANFERLASFSYAESVCRWGNVHFVESGKLRLLHTSGFLQGLALAEPTKAYALADSLCRYLDRFGDYGGMIDSPEGRKDVHGDLLRFPAYRIVLSDDGGLGSFGVLWFAAIPHKKFMDAAEAAADRLAAERHGEGKTYADLNQEQADPLWRDALEDTRLQLKIRDDLTVDRGYFPDWDTNRDYYSREYVYYGYSHNGGLIYHFGNDVTEGSWSSHT
jgi:hypothetical protein